MATFYMTHSAELYHYGVLGMKWGVRRYQNPDGTLTAAGHKRYNKAQYKQDKKERRQLGSLATMSGKTHRNAVKKLEKVSKRYDKHSTEKNKARLKDARAVADFWKSRSDADKTKLYSKVQDMTKRYSGLTIKQVRTKADKYTGSRVKEGVLTRADAMSFVSNIVPYLGPVANIYNQFHGRPVSVIPLPIIKRVQGRIKAEEQAGFDRRANRRAYRSTRKYGKAISRTRYAYN